MTTATLYLLLPEIVLIAAAVAIYLGGAFSAGKKGTVPICAKHPPGRSGKWGLSDFSPTARHVWRWIAGGAILAAAVILWTQHGPADAAAPLHFDELAWLTRWLALGFGVLFVLLTSRLNSDATAEYVGSLLLTIAGLMLVGVAGDLVLAVRRAGIDLDSHLRAALPGPARRGLAGSDGQVFLSQHSRSAILLYGFSFLYGIAGSTELSSVRSALDGTKPLPPGFAAFARIALALVFGGLCFRIAAVPFHFYAPDVYQGTTHANAALLSVVPKAAGFLVMTRILVAAMPEHDAARRGNSCSASRS